MARVRHLRNAPIREALVDIAVKLPDDVDFAVLQSLKDRVFPDYPKSSEMMRAEFQVELPTSKATSFARQAVGIACRNADENRVVQFRLNGFTYNWLKPYSTWEDLRAVAETYWQVYSESVKPISVTRLALRYINNIVLPLPFGDFGEYLEAQPRIPEALPQTLSQFLTRISIVDEATGLGAIVTHVFEGRIKPTELTVILDIDASKHVMLRREQTLEVWQIFDQLHTFKNRIFFESLTEKAVGLFE